MKRGGRSLHGWAVPAWPEHNLQPPRPQPPEGSSHPEWPPSLRRLEQSRPGTTSHHLRGFHSWSWVERRTLQSDREEIRPHQLDPGQWQCRLTGGDWQWNSEHHGGRHPWYWHQQRLQYEIPQSVYLCQLVSYVLTWDFRSCGIPDTRNDFLYLTGGGNCYGGCNTKLVTKYDAAGYLEDLPELITGRHFHACAGYYSQRGNFVLLVAGGRVTDDGWY